MTSGREIGDGGIQIVHLDDEVVDGADVLNRSRGVVHELDADERIVGQLEHGEAAQLRLGDTAELGVPQRGVEGERASRSETRSPMCSMRMLGRLVPRTKEMLIIAAVVAGGTFSGIDAIPGTPEGQIGRGQWGACPFSG